MAVSVWGSVSARITWPSTVSVPVKGDVVPWVPPLASQSRMMLFVAPALLRVNQQPLVVVGVNHGVASARPGSSGSATPSRLATAVRTLPRVTRLPPRCRPSGCSSKTSGAGEAILTRRGGLCRRLAGGAVHLRHRGLRLLLLRAIGPRLIALEQDECRPPRSPDQRGWRAISQKTAGFFRPGRLVGPVARGGILLLRNVRADSARSRAEALLARDRRARAEFQRNSDWGTGFLPLRRSSTSWAACPDRRHDGPKPG